MAGAVRPGGWQTGSVHGTVTHLHRSESHSFSKNEHDALVLVAGMGVEGDAHFGATVKHRSRVKADPLQPNLRQVHLMQRELHDELRAAGFSVGPGDLGENITTAGLDLLSLPVGTMLRIGDHALVALTGLRNPCSQIDDFQAGLLKEVLGRDSRRTRRSQSRRDGRRGARRHDPARRPHRGCVAARTSRPPRSRVRADDPGEDPGPERHDQEHRAPKLINDAEPLPSSHLLPRSYF